jgi:hypothetical protein
MRREWVLLFQEGFSIGWKKSGRDPKRISYPAHYEIEYMCSYWLRVGLQSRIPADGTNGWKWFLAKAFDDGVWWGKDGDPTNRLQRRRSVVEFYPRPPKPLPMPRSEKDLRDAWIKSYCVRAGNMVGAEEEAAKHFLIWLGRVNPSLFPREMKGERLWAWFRRQAQDCGTDAGKRYASEGKGHAAARQGGGKELSRAITWLQKALTARGGRMAKADVMAEGKRAGFKQATLYRAREQCGVKDKSSGFGRDKRAVWILPSKDDQKPKAKEEVLRKEYPHLAKALDEFRAQRVQTLPQFARIADKNKPRRGKGRKGYRDIMSANMVSLDTIPEPASYPDDLPARPKRPPKGDDDDSFAYTINQIFGKRPAQRQAPQRIGDGEEPGGHHPDLAPETQEQDNPKNDEGRD